MLKKWYFISLLTLICNIAKSQIPHLYTMQQGLKSSYIESLYVDKANFVWVSTTTSLEVFDGYRFEDVSVIDEKSGKQLFNKVNEVRQIDDHHYWIQSNIGLYVYDLHNNSSEKVMLSEMSKKLTMAALQLLRQIFPPRTVSCISLSGRCLIATASMRHCATSRN